jgi:hypothetical protein
VKPYALAVLLAAAAAPAAALAQHSDPAGPHYPSAHPGPRGDLGVVAVNALLGGLTAGTLQKARGGSFQDGFTRGLAGGAVGYAGKRVAVQHFPGAGLAGRELAAVGSSVVRNAAEGRPSFERLTLPFTIVRVEVRTGERRGVRARLDMHAAFWTAYGFADPNLELDAGATLSAGAAVFRTSGRELVLYGHRVTGLALPGTILLGDWPGRSREGYDRLLAHERVHILQQDQLFLYWDEALQRAIAPRVPGVAWAHRFADVDVAFVSLVGIGTLLLPYAQRPWEAEAIFLAGR